MKNKSVYGNKINDNGEKNYKWGMIKKIIIAPDSFKGSLTAQEVADAMEQGVRRVLGDEVEIIKLPIADGGEGTMEILVRALAGERVVVAVHDPLMRIIQASYGIVGGDTAVIEMAAASGLTLLAAEERNPMNTSTFGFGEMIADALRRGCRNFMLCIGGSATNDGGVGMLQALGYRFYNKGGLPISPVGGELLNIAYIDTSAILPELKKSCFKVACDVTNPFYGHEGAAYVYAPQKGADPQMVEQLDAGLRHLAALISRTFSIDINAVPGSGAAGGLGGGLYAFLSAQLLPGIEMVLDTLNFEQMIEGADMIITGEGKIDAQTAMGKAVSGVLRRAQRQAIPVIALAGLVEDESVLQQFGFAGIYAIHPVNTPLKQAMLPDFSISNIEDTLARIL